MKSAVLSFQILLILLCGALAHPANDGTVAERSIVENHRELKQEVTRTKVSRNEGQEVVETLLDSKTWRPTVKCADIVPEDGEPGAENHEACEAHCTTLIEEYRHGKCLKGLCHCQKIQRNTKIAETQQRKQNGGHPTVRCEHIHPEEGKAAHDNHRACQAHCHNLHHELQHGECMEGVCHCSRETSVAVVKVSTTPEGTVRQKRTSQ